MTYPILTRDRDYLYRQIKREALWRVFCNYGSPIFHPINALAAYYRIDMTEIHRVFYSLESNGLHGVTFRLNELWDVFATSLIEAGCCDENDRSLVRTRLHVSIRAEYGNPRWWSSLTLKALVMGSHAE
jgi:hypothetical protein